MPFLRLSHNPVLSPRADLDESGIYNPGVFVHDGTVFLIPRVRRLSTRESFFTLAWSGDGSRFERLPYAIMRAAAPYEAPIPDRERETGGVEDCRVTLLGDRIHLVYTAYNRRCHLAMARMDLSRFLGLWDRARRADVDLSAEWNGAWERLGPVFPEMLASEEHFTRNGCLFEAGGRHNLWYRKDYGDVSLVSADDPAGPWEPERLSFGRDFPWEQDRVGISSPPVQTGQDTYAFLYHGVEKGPPKAGGDHTRTYHLGLFELGLSRETGRPERVTKRPEPVLSPAEPYEIRAGDWLHNDKIKVAAVFSCGMARLGGKLLVPYGAGDHHICAGFLDYG